MDHAPLRIFTIGYEGATMPDFLGALAAAGVGRVIDVRALPLSRFGSSKTLLCNALAKAGIDYHRPRHCDRALAPGSRAS